jgi:hypothetical protein
LLKLADNFDPPAVQHLKNCQFFQSWKGWKDALKLGSQTLAQNAEGITESISGFEVNLYSFVSDSFIDFLY